VDIGKNHAQELAKAVEQVQEADKKLKQWVGPGTPGDLISCCLLFADMRVESI
jgi:hypothetical protein